jgi:hypothetical protein
MSLQKFYMRCFNTFAEICAVFKVCVDVYHYRRIAVEERQGYTLITYFPNTYAYVVRPSHGFLVSLKDTSFHYSTGALLEIEVMTGVL